MAWDLLRCCQSRERTSGLRSEGVEPFSAEDARSIGVGTVAKESRREMALIQHNADKHSRTRDPGRTFAAGLRWFCGRVKAQVAARLAGEPGLSDVVEVCQAWEDGLVAS